MQTHLRILNKSQIICHPDRDVLVDSQKLWYSLYSFIFLKSKFSCPPTPHFVLTHIYFIKSLSQLLSYSLTLPALECIYRVFICVCVCVCIGCRRFCGPGGCEAGSGQPYSRRESDRRGRRKGREWPAPYRHTGTCHHRHLLLSLLCVCVCGRI